LASGELRAETSRRSALTRSPNTTAR
jgi:hypothetical protein